MKFNEKNLCAFSKVPPYDLEGYLQKRGDINKVWQKRYFVLKGNLLFYFDRKSDKIDREPLGLIILEGSRIELCEEEDLGHCFEIIFSGNRKYTLSADDQQLMELWMKTLAISSYEYKKALVEELQMQIDEIHIAKKLAEQTNSTTKITTAIETLTPKPPPRRQNPFNRPAPPPPVSSSTHSTTTTIVNQIGDDSTSPDPTYTSENNTSEMWHNQNTNNTTTKSNIDELLCNNNSNNALRYNWETFGEDSANSFNVQHNHCSPINEQQQSTSAAATNNKNNETFTFRYVHETFKKIILNDINEIRSQKQNTIQPLIQL